MVRSSALLKKQEVIDEINRHKYFESEKVGYDVGFDWAKDDWMKRFAKQWEGAQKQDKKRGPEGPQFYSV